MGKKLLSFICLIAIVVLAAPTPVFSGAPAKSVQDLGMFQVSKFDAHYRVPSEAGVELILSQQNVVSPDGSERAAAIQQFYTEFNSRNPDTVDPRKSAQLLAVEQGKAAPLMVQDTGASEPKIMSLAVPVEFNGTDTVTQEIAGTDVNGDPICTTEVVTQTGPLHNEIPAPGPRDNNTLWYDNTTPELYNEIFFGEGPDAGVVVNHPNLGEVDLRGLTMVNYYLEQSKGKFRPYGEVYPKWFQVDHAEAYYGANSCAGSHNVRAAELVQTVLDLIAVDSPDFNWQSYDGDGDGVVDNFTIIHAGMGQEAGGGDQGDLSIWSHASLVGWPDGLLVCSAGSTGCPDRDVRVMHYSMDPENIDLGVIAEEFGHAALGLPDMYSTDLQNPISNWAIMESGSWNGILGGTQPAPFPLFFRYILGWSSPVEMDYTGAKSVVVGQHSLKPKGTADGIKINMPTKEITTDNPLGTGQALWSDLGNGLQNTAAFSVDLTTATAPVLTMQSYWSIETDWDYGYIDVSTDSGATWANQTDTSGVCTTTDPNGNNVGCGITGIGMGPLTYDLTAFAGQSIMVRVRYSTDTAVQYDGWWIDDVTVTDGVDTLFSDDFEGGAGNWDTNGWLVVPMTKSYARYYLVEWRNNSGFDQGLKYAYQTVYSDADEWEVDRAPYTVPGMLVWFRDTSFAFDYDLGSNLMDGPSWGIKDAITIVDSHPFPYTFDYPASSGLGIQVSSRVNPANSAFTLGDTTPFTLRLGYDPATGIYQDNPVETKTFEAQPGVHAFHDSKGYYPGLMYSEVTSGLYWVDQDGGSVVPAKGDYSTRIVDLNFDPFYPLFGAGVGNTVLGTGNPVDDGVQYGVHIAPVQKAKDGSWALIKVWNSTKPLLRSTVKAVPVAPHTNGALNYGVRVTNRSKIAVNYTIVATVPDGTTYRVSKGTFDPATNTVTFEATVKAGHSKYIPIMGVTVNGDMTGQKITATIHVIDKSATDVPVVKTVKVRGVAP